MMRAAGPWVWLLGVLSGISLAAQSTGMWLDRPLNGWNVGGSVPSARARTAVSRDALTRCKLTAPASTVPSVSLTRQGWWPFLHLDSVLSRQDVEIVAGLVDVTPACEPIEFNLFVFVDGLFAGTLAPVPMTTARDGAIGAVRIVNATTLTAEFARYAAGDAECCPSSRVRVAYRVDRGAMPVVTPVSSQVLR